MSRKIYPVFSAGIRVCYKGQTIEIKDSRERAFSLVSKMGAEAFIEFYDSEGIFDRIFYNDVLEIARIQTPELVKKKKKNPKYATLFCFKCHEIKPAEMFYDGECGDCNIIVFLP